MRLRKDHYQGDGDYPCRRETNALVLSGGGVHGLHILGALERFAYYPDNSRGPLLNGIRRIVGTSVGYLIGMLLSAGYEPIEIMASVASSDLTKRLSDSVDFAGAFTGDGVLSFSLIRDHLASMLHKKGFREDVTLAELKRASGVRLEASAYCLSTQKLRFFSSESDPEMKCLDLARLACSVPVLFDPGSYEGMAYIDGAVLENFPISRAEPGDVVFGVRIMTDNNVEMSSAPFWTRNTSLGQTAMKLFNIFAGIASQLQNAHRREKSLANSIVLEIHCQSEGTLQFSGINGGECMRRFMLGFSDCSMHLKKHD